MPGEKCDTRTFLNPYRTYCPRGTIRSNLRDWLGLKNLQIRISRKLYALTAGSSGGPGTSEWEGSQSRSKEREIAMGIFGSTSGGRKPKEGELGTSGLLEKKTLENSLEGGTVSPQRGPLRNQPPSSPTPSGPEKFRQTAVYLRTSKQKQSGFSTRRRNGRTTKLTGTPHPRSVGKSKGSQPEVNLEWEPSKSFTYRDRDRAAQDRDAKKN